jgi:hypothetical protein
MNRRQVGLIVMLLASLFYIFGAFWPTYNGTKYWSATYVIIQGLFPGIPGLLGVVFTIRSPKNGSTVTLMVSCAFALFFFLLMFDRDMVAWFPAMLLLTAIVYILGAVLCYYGSDLKLGILGK